MNPEEGLILISDGSCYWKDRKGGWAFLVRDAFNESIARCGFVLDTTSQRMEMQAVIEGLKWIHKEFGPSIILLRSDSEYVGKGMTDRTRKRKVNVDLWLEIDMWVDAHYLVEWEHVRGHTGDEDNEYVDKLASEVREYNF